MSRKIDRNEIQLLAKFRSEIRRFLQFSEQAATAAGLQPQQHQLMLQIAGAPDDTLVTVSHIAEVMGLRHHTVVELSKRCELAGLVRRTHDQNDRRFVVLSSPRKASRRSASSPKPTLNSCVNWPPASSRPSRAYATQNDRFAAPRQRVKTQHR